MNNKVNIFWFRRDLRLKDNIGLYWALKSGTPVIPIFIFDKNILNKLETNDTRVTFIHQELSSIRDKVRSEGSELLTFFDTPESVWKSLTQNFEIGTVFTNEDYEPYAIKRDNLIAKILDKKNIKLMKYSDHCIFSKDDILKKDGKPYTVFTPYKRKWLEALTPEKIASYSSEKHLDKLKKGLTPSFHSLGEIGFSERNNFKFPAKIIRKKIINEYHKNRNIPSLDATSHLGMHLRFGTISVRRAVQIAYELNETWLSELVWREFFIQILYHFPHVQKKSFKPKYENIQWINNKKRFSKMV